MFAFFGLGLQELVLLCMLGGGAIGAVLLVLFLSNRGSGRTALEDENRRLREENDRLRGEGPSQP